MVKGLNNFTSHDFFKITKINDHSVFYMFRVVNGLSNNSDIQFVTVPVNIFTKAVIAIKRFLMSVYGHSGLRNFWDTRGRYFHASWHRYNTRRQAIHRREKVLIGQLLWHKEKA